MPIRGLHLPARHRLAAAAAIAVVGAVVLAACGSSGGSSQSKVATLGTGVSAAAGSATTVPANTQDALLAYAKCMRDNGVAMKDPTFDASGKPTGGLFGPSSGVDPRSAEFQTAQKTCGSLIAGVTLGGPGGGLDRNAIQTAMNSFTKCLRDNGQNVDDITFGNGQGAGAGGPGFGGPPPSGATGGATGAASGGSTPAGGSAPAGGFGGPPPSGGAPGGPGGAGFNPSDRIIQQLGLDATDPAVTKAVAACQSILDGAFRPQTSTTTTAG